LGVEVVLYMLRKVSDLFSDFRLEVGDFLANSFGQVCLDIGHDLVMKCLCSHHACVFGDGLGVESKGFFSPDCVHLGFFFGSSGYLSVSKVKVQCVSLLSLWIGDLFHCVSSAVSQGVALKFGQHMYQAGD